MNTKLSLKPKMFGFKEVKWLARALASKNTNIQLYQTRLYKNGSILSGCDGKRLHIIEDSIISYFDKDGFYEIIKNTKAEIIVVFDEENKHGKYPDIKFLIEPRKNFKPNLSTGVFVSTDNQWGHKKILNSVYTKIIRNMRKANETYDYYYISDVLNFKNSVFEINVTNESKMKPAYFKYKNMFAVIMPVHMVY